MDIKREISCLLGDVFEKMPFTHLPLNGYRVLMYHSIGSALCDDPRKIYSIEPVVFRQQLELLDHSGITILPLEEGLEYRDRLSIAITFDDGYRDNLHAASILAENGIPFTVFVSAGLINKNELFLNTGELKELSMIPGCIIGSHGLTHVPLASCSKQELVREVQESKARLEEMIGLPIEAFSFPYGSMNREAYECVKGAGYQLAVTSFPGINSKDEDRFALRRTLIDARDNQKVFQQKITGAWDWYRWLYRKNI